MANFCGGNTSIILDDGGQTCFWSDLWCADKSFCFLFHNVYNVVKQEHALVGELWKEEMQEGYGRFVLIDKLKIESFNHPLSFMAFINAN